MYLTALAISDLIVLYSGLLRWWLIHLLDIDIRLLREIGCKIDWYLIFASTELSSWLLVAVTCERIISTTWPHKVRVCCTQRTALVTIATMSLMIYGGSIHLLYGVGINKFDIHNIKNKSLNTKNDLDQSTGSLSLRSTVTIETSQADSKNGSQNTSDGKVYCSGSVAHPDYRDFFIFIYPWVDLFLYFAIPAIILAGGEVLIIKRLMESHRMRKNMSKVQTTTTTKYSDKSSSIAIMLLTVNAVFIICTTPVCIYLVGMPYWVDPAVGFTVTQEILWTVINLLMYLNHTINFILYFLSGARFRRNVKNFFSRRETDLSFVLRDMSEDRMGMSRRRHFVTGSENGDSNSVKLGMSRVQSVNTIGTDSEYYISDITVAV
ncbi:hypothetical protein ACF0H5_019498 [Mactra antiquata]